ncbi:MAG: hypothetical protein JW806_01805 [Sedimentisphaerales bacterium]|nr:hypothetical protein [Sedimentisphaerales bacterium]
MAVVAPLAKFKKTNFKIYIAALLIGAAYFAYDGFFNKKFIEKHTVDDKPDSTLVFNQKAPPFLLAGAVVMAVWFVMVKDKKLIAEDTELVFSDKDKIPYNSIESINKTNFESKGFFFIEYKTSDGKISQRKVSDRTYDNLGAVLEVVVSKITG